MIISRQFLSYVADISNFYYSILEKCRHRLNSLLDVLVKAKIQRTVVDIRNFNAQVWIYETSIAGLP